MCIDLKICLGEICQMHSLSVTLSCHSCFLAVTGQYCTQKSIENSIKSLWNVPRHLENSAHGQYVYTVAFTDLHIISSRSECVIQDQGGGVVWGWGVGCKGF